MTVNGRSAVGIAMIWLATVAGVSATAWVAIDRAGRDLTDAGVGSIVPGSVRAAPETPTTLITAPTTPTTPATSPKPVKSTPAPKDRTVKVAGGQVSVRCTDATILLRIAQPDNGWRVQVNSSGPVRIDLRFRLDDESETRVTAACRTGSPVFSVPNEG